MIEQYKEEINLIIADEVAERKIEQKEEAFIQSLENKIKQKEWVKTTKKCDETKTEQIPVENNNRLIVTTKEGYEITIEVNNEKLIAKIIDVTKTTEEEKEDENQEEKTELNLSITNNKITEGTNISINATSTKRLQKIELKAQDVVIYSEENVNAKIYNRSNLGIDQIKNLDQLPFFDDMTVTLETTTSSGTKEIKSIQNVKNYTVSTPMQLTALANVVNSGNTLERETIIQLADIDVNKGMWTANEDGTATFTSSATQWPVIGNSDYNYDTNTSFNEKNFKGTYNGNQQKIEGVYINTTSKDMVGLFGINEGTIKNVNLKNSIINARYQVGGIVGGNSGNIENCNNYASVSGNRMVGGICGWSSNILKNNVNYGKVSGVPTLYCIVDYLRLGGITGWGSGQILKCGNYGTINSGGVATEINTVGVGGIVGETIRVDISKSYNLGTIINNCTSNQQYGNGTGGIIGFSAATEGNTIVSQCYNKGKIIGVQVGGITSWIYYIKTEDCYNTGTLQGTQYVGGILGWTGQQSNSNGSIINSYNVGTVSGGINSCAGGVLADYGAIPILTNCYNLNTSSTYAVGQTTGGWGTLDDTWPDHIVTKTEADMKNLAGTLGSNWSDDINNINDGYPILKWQLEE